MRHRSLSDALLAGLINLQLSRRLSRMWGQLAQLKVLYPIRCIRLLVASPLLRLLRPLDLVVYRHVPLRHPRAAHLLTWPLPPGHTHRPALGPSLR